MGKILSISQEAMNAIEDLALDYYYETHTGQMIIKKYDTPSKDMKELNKWQSDYYLMGFIDGLIALYELDVINCDRLILDSMREDFEKDIPELRNTPSLNTPNYSKGIAELLMNFCDFSST